ncbi:MAG: hypothetical protein ABSG46_02000 [Candidatus Binataceae bacterium]|jgi:hypothetical protein
MKASRAAILALLIMNGCAQQQSGPGWNLMVPPLTADGLANTSAPLAQWRSGGNYDSRKTCIASLQQGQFGAGAQFGPITQASSWMEDSAVQIMSGQCIAANDPRLSQASPAAGP